MAAHGRFTDSAAKQRVVKEVQFGILSPDEIRSMSVLKVEFSDIRDENGKNLVGGLSDPRLGTTDRNFKCQTCGESMNDCPGHFGHIDLARPVYHIGFIKKVKKILESVCFHCGKLKADVVSGHGRKCIKSRHRWPADEVVPRDPQMTDPLFASVVKGTQGNSAFSRLRRFHGVWQVCSKKLVCEASPIKEEDDMGPDLDGIGHGGCGHTQPVIRREGLKMYASWKKGKDDDEEGGKAGQPEKRLLPASEALQILKKISDEDIELMGLSTFEARPEWMIISVLPVAPPPVRPGVAEGGSAKGEDDLTYKLADIIKASTQLKKFEQEGAPAHIVGEFEDLLQFHCATYMDNDIAGIPQAMQKSGRPVKSIRARLKGKEGRLRGNLMGKRVDFSARTVITGDPNLELDQVGVPKSIARNLTYPEKVTPYNISYLQQLVRNGPNEWPGARYVVRDTGERIDLKYNRRADMALQFGWTVERHLKDGDFVLFNRQPSLHKMSMMCHRVKLMDFSTFRLNLSVTPPYNADFDGDEMNLHVPQSEETRAELSQIAWVPRQIVSPQANKPVMGIVQDTLCGIRKFTLRDCLLDFEQLQNILLWVPNWDGVVPMPCILKPKPYWSGKQIMSMCIPKGINVFLGDAVKATTNNSTDDGVCIENGEIFYGVINKKVVGSSAGGLIHIIFREKGPEICRDFFGGCQRVVNYWLLHNGFSIGIGDTVADKATATFITEEIIRAKGQVDRYIQDARLDRMKAEAGMTLRESFESKVNRELNTARDTVGSRAEKDLPNWNNVKQMVIAGSKGSFINISQMSACVGQQSVEGKRIPFGFRHRTLPHFSKDDFSPESRGFVENSYLRGLTPQEFFFHAMAGREGLIDTAVKTAETGYIQRRLVKAMEDIMVCYDGTVRNSTNSVIQFAYGEDGIDGAMVERQHLLTHRLNDKDFARRFKVDLHEGGFKKGTLQAGLADWSQELQTLLDEEFEQLTRDRITLRTEIFHDNRGDVYLPMNIARLVLNARQEFNIDPRKPSDLAPRDIILELRSLLERLVVVRGTDPISMAAQENATLLFKIHLRSFLSTRNVIEYLRLNREAFSWVLGEIEQQFAKSVVNPGEMCGTLAAQSIGEPATQMTLNTFHYAGVSSKNVTLGVPRLKEIINCAENIKTPSLSVYLSPEYSQTEESAKVIQTALTHTTLRTVTSAVEIHFDPDPVSTTIEDDRDFVEAFFAIPDEEVERTLDRQSAWLLRLVLDRAQMLDKNLTMAEVAAKISQTFNDDLFVMHSEDNAEQLVLRIRVVDNDADKSDQQDENDFLKLLSEDMLNQIDLKGVKGIKKVFIVSQDKVHQRVNAMSGAWEPVREWILETDGSNLREVLAVDGVDAARTISNNCVEILKVFGIEAARNSVLRESKAVIEFDGSYVNYRHLALLCDIMTTRGQLMAITRHGINRTNQGALMRCTFEETVEILMEAAAMGNLDHCQGVAENVLLGQIAPMGTGSFQVCLDVDMLKDVIVNYRMPVQAAMQAQLDPTGSKTPLGMMTPYDSNSPMSAYGYNMDASAMAAFSPLAQAQEEFNDYLGSGQTPMRTPMGGMTSPGGGLGFSPVSPMVGYSPSSPAYATSPAMVSPFVRGGYSTSPNIGFGNASPAFRADATSPSYSPSSPLIGNHGMASPRYGAHLASPRYNGATSPRFDQAVSPQWSPSAASPRFSPVSPMAGNHGLTSPKYDPTGRMGSPQAASPVWSPASPMYSSNTVTSPAWSPASPKQSPTSPAWSPASPAMSPASPRDGDGGAAGANAPRRSRFTQQSMWSR